jgi:hypothetical protein
MHVAGTHWDPEQTNCGYPTQSMSPVHCGTIPVDEVLVAFDVAALIAPPGPAVPEPTVVDAMVTAVVSPMVDDATKAPPSPDDVALPPPVPGGITFTPEAHAAAISATKASEITAAATRAR